MVKESARKIIHDNATQMILVVNRCNKQGNCGGLISLSYTPIKAYRAAVLSYQIGYGYR
jgi:hypothetical protein